MAICNWSVACCFVMLPIYTCALLHAVPGKFSCRSSGHCGVSGPSQPTALHVFFSDGKKTGTNNVNVNGNADFFKTLELKDEALLQAQTAVSSLETALESAVTNLENMQQQLQLQVVQLEQELENTKQVLSATQSELEQAKSELQATQAELAQSREETNQLQIALAQSQEAAKRADQLEAYVTTLKDNGSNAAAAPPAAPVRKDAAENPWQIFSANQKVIPVLNEWIAIKGSSEGEVQISGKVTNHPTIPDGDAIVTSPLTDPSRAGERRVVTTLSGSKYRLGTPMSMPSQESASMKVTSPKKSPQQLIKARSSISLPDLTGNTLGNG